MRSIFDSIRNAYSSKPAEKFSLENLKHLYSQLARNPVIDEHNEAIVVDTLRDIAELIVWGDQHDETFFDFFLEKNILSFMLSIVSPPSVDANVRIQLIQTLSMMIENIRKSGSLYFILSNNRINDLISYQFDFSNDDDLMAHYISFLKTLALKLDQNTVQFFFDARQQQFPLLTEAAIHHNHRETMVQTAVRNLVLQVLRVDDAAMQTYLEQRFVTPFVGDLAHHLVRSCLRLEMALNNELAPISRADALRRGSFTRRVSPSTLSDIIDDEILYMNDVTCAARAPVALLWSSALFRHWILPLLLACTCVTDSSNGQNSDTSDSSDTASDSSDTSDNHAAAEQSSQANNAMKLAPVNAWAILARALARITFAPLFSAIVKRLVPGVNNAPAVAGAVARCAREKTIQTDLRGYFAMSAKAPRTAVTEIDELGCENCDNEQIDDALLLQLQAESDSKVLPALCVLGAICENRKCMDKSELFAKVMSAARIDAVVEILCKKQCHYSADVRLMAVYVLAHLKCADERLRQTHDALESAVKAHLASPWSLTAEPAYNAALKTAKRKDNVIDIVDSIFAATANEKPLLDQVPAPPSTKAAENEEQEEERTAAPLPPLRWREMVIDFYQFAFLQKLLPQSENRKTEE